MREAAVTTILTVLTPIIPGHDRELDATLTELSTNGSTLDHIGSVHFARWVVIGSVRGEFPRLSRRRRQLRMKYLLLTAAVDGPFEDFVEQLRTTVAPLTRSIWSHCVGCPDLADPIAFHAYFAHNRLAVPHSFLAYENTVPDVLGALELRTQHLALARTVQSSGADPLAAFQAARFT
jgi:hypothetical protein